MHNINLALVDQEVRQRSDFVCGMPAVIRAPVDGEDL